MSREGYRLPGALSSASRQEFTISPLATERSVSRREDQDQPMDPVIEQKSRELNTRKSELAHESRSYRAFESSLALGGRQLFELYGAKFFEAARNVVHEELNKTDKTRKFDVSMYDIICRLEPDREERMKLYDLMEEKAAQTVAADAALHDSYDKDFMKASKQRTRGLGDVEWHRGNQLQLELALASYRKMDSEQASPGAKRLTQMVQNALQQVPDRFIGAQFNAIEMAGINDRVAKNLELMYADAGYDIESVFQGWNAWIRKESEELDAESKTFRDEVRAKMDELIRPIEERYMEKMLALTKRLEDIDNEPAVIEARRAKTNPFSADTAEQFDVLLEERLNRANTQRDQTLNSIPQIEKEMDRLVSQMRVELKNATWKYRQLLETMRDNDDVQKDIMKGRYSYNDSNKFTYY